jgi:REP element-mobilizing transposase RayT
MAFYRRHLPHIDEPGRAVFITWRLQGSLPPNRSFLAGTVGSGRAFVAMDRLLEQARTGPSYLRNEAVAYVVVEAIRYGTSGLGHYELHAYAVMPNHVHLLCTPRVALRVLTNSLKGITAKRANQILGLTGRFWQEESYDHVIRNELEFERVRNYIEENPVRAGLAAHASDFRWSSAWAGRGRPAADQGVRPT